MNKPEFQITFVVGRGEIFNVNYYTLGNNNSPHFTTAAGIFNRPRTDFNQCGQCQEDVLRNQALAFFHKWDKLHLKDLTQDQYDEIVSDIKDLKKVYRYFIETEGEDIRFSEEVELERQWRTR